MSKPVPKRLEQSEIPVIARQLVSKVKFPFLATIDGNQPRVRPVSPVYTRGFEVYIGNLRSYQKTREIEENNQVELCYLDEDHNQVRITGKAEILKDRELMEMIWQKNPLLRHYLGNIDNPELVVYFVRPEKVRFMQEWALEYVEVQI